MKSAQRQLTERRSIARSSVLGLRHIFDSAVAPSKTSPTLGTLNVMAILAFLAIIILVLGGNIMNYKIVISISISLLLFSCVTPYQRYSTLGGYDETQLDENVFNVAFYGNGYTSLRRAVDFAFLRCAELTIKYKFKYFVISDASKEVANSSYTTPIVSQTYGSINFYKNSAYGSSSTLTYGGDTYNIQKPRVFLTIVLFKEKPDTDATVISAEFLYKSISKKYELKQ
jgi:hypothetical protein